MTRVYGRSAVSVCASTSSGVFVLVTRRNPSFRIGFQMGWRPYHAHDSTPFTSVSSTAIVTSTTAGSYFAIEASSSRLFIATTANCFAGTPLRSGESPYRANAVPVCPRLRAASTIERQIRCERLLENAAVDDFDGDGGLFDVA